MEFHHRSIPEILKQQEQELSRFQQEKKLEYDRLHSQMDKHGSFDGYEEMRSNLDKLWNEKELELTKKLRNQLHDRLISIDNELFPEPGPQQEPDEKELIAEEANELKKKHRGEFNRLGGMWREELQKTDHSTHETVNKWYTYVEHQLLERQGKERKAFIANHPEYKGLLNIIDWEESEKNKEISERVAQAYRELEERQEKEFNKFVAKGEQIRQSSESEYHRMAVDLHIEETILSNKHDEERKELSKSLREELNQEWEIDHAIDPKEKIRAIMEQIDNGGTRTHTESNMLSSSRLESRHELELNALAGEWRKEIRGTQPPKHDRINREYQHREEELLIKQQEERDRIAQTSEPLQDIEKDEKRASILRLLHRNKDQEQDIGR